MDGLLALLLLALAVMIGGAVTWIVLNIITAILGLGSIGYGACCFIYFLLQLIF